MTREGGDARSERTYLVSKAGESDSDKDPQKHSSKPRWRILLSSCKHCLKHTFLVLLLLGYVFLGGFLFSTIEGDHEKHVKTHIGNSREVIVEALWTNRTEIGEEEWRKLADTLLVKFEDILRERFDEGFKSSSVVHDWDFWSASFFAGTVVTTIGYGQIAPVTDLGRIVCILYAILGIPLLLIVLADIGKVFTRFIKFLWSFVRRYYYTGKFLKIRRQTNDMFSRSHVTPPKDTSATLERTGSKRVGTPPAAGKTPVQNRQSLSIVPVFEVDDEFDLPVTVALLLLVNYLVIGSALFSIREDWTYVDAFYFCFISVSTIGFGDMVPVKPFYVVAASVYIVFGLALTSMVINVFQEYMTRKYSEATESVTKRLGLRWQESEDQAAADVTPEVAGVHKRKPTVKFTPEDATEVPDNTNSLETPPEKLAKELRGKLSSDDTPPNLGNNNHK